MSLFKDLSRGVPCVRLILLSTVSNRWSAAAGIKAKRLKTIKLRSKDRFDEASKHSTNLETALQTVSY